MPAIADPVCMGRKPKNPTPAGADREKYRKFHKPVRIRGQLVVVAEVAATELAQDFTQWVNDAVRMRLVSEGRWPPPPKPRG